MYIYIDETFELEKGKKNQFMAVAGFAASNPYDVAKWYQKVKRKALPKRYAAKEIKSTNAFSDIYILPEIFSNKWPIPKVEIRATVQYKKILRKEFYYKGELNYDLLYVELTKNLLLQGWQYMDRDITIVTLDTFKTKTIHKEGIAHALQTELKLQNPDSNFRVTFGTSEEKNLQFADQICGIVNKFALGDKERLARLENLTEVKIVKNPFSRN